MKIIPAILLLCVGNSIADTPSREERTRQTQRSEASLTIHYGGADKVDVGIRDEAGEIARKLTQKELSGLFARMGKKGLLRVTYWAGTVPEPPIREFGNFCLDAGFKRVAFYDVPSVGKVTLVADLTASEKWVYWEQPHVIEAPEEKERFLEHWRREKAAKEADTGS